MKIGFHEDHWWILVNGQKAYRLSIPRDITPEDARKHATNVLIYLCERAEVGHSLSTAREGTTEAQPASGSASQPSRSLSDRSRPRDAAVSHPQGRQEHCHRRDFDEIDNLTSHLIGDKLRASGCLDPVGRHSVHASAREDPPAVVSDPINDLDIVRLAISRRADMVYPPACADTEEVRLEGTVRTRDRASGEWHEIELPPLPDKIHAGFTYRIHPRDPDDYDFTPEEGRRLRMLAEQVCAPHDTCPERVNDFDREAAFELAKMIHAKYQANVEIARILSPVKPQ